MYRNGHPGKLQHFVGLLHIHVVVYCSFKKFPPAEAP